MANNTIMTAKNTFGDGLLMDFAPDNTQATCLTNALNATLVTMNGNELSLQNDMGNGRVETAFLPEGYVPLGTCEFGDIIYIVSYNPLINKSQIGCFPSPERNIDSTELEGETQTLSASDFFDENGNIINKSVKKVLISNTLNPGDKYLIYTDDSAKGLSCLSDYSNTDHIKGGFPRELKLSIVAIEDSGRINYIDSNINWYSNNKQDFFILKSGKDTALSKEDIDSYRTKVSSAYNIFQSKVSGKLAILAELESITSFSCSQSIYQTKEKEKDENGNEVDIIKYHLYLNTSWTTDNPDVNPSGVVIYDQTANGKYPELLKEYDSNNKEIEPQFNYISKYQLDSDCKYDEYKSIYCYSTLTNGLPTFISISNQIENSLPSETKYNVKQAIGDTKNQTIEVSQDGTYNDVILNNYYNKDISKQIAVFTKPLNSSSDSKFTYTICPFMTYGKLKEFSISNTIDFSKLGSGEITLEEWRYYKQGDVMHLTFGLNTYEEEGKGVKEVSLEFYDYQGMAGRISLTNKNSYSGTFSLAFNLGDFNNTILSTDISSNPIKHKGNGPYSPDDANWDTKTDSANLTELVKTGVFIEEKTEENNIVYYENDSGIIYPNLLYGVKILVYYQDKNSLGGFDDGFTTEPKTFYRSMWTNEMYNDKYYDTKDFKDLNVSLDFSANSLFKEASGFSCANNQVTHNSYKTDKTNQEELNKLIPYYSLGYNKYVAEGNINLYIQPILQNTYDTFNLSEDLKKGGVGTIQVRCGNKNIVATDTSWVSSKDSKTFDYLDLIKPNITLNTNKELSYPDTITKDNCQNWINSLQDSFDINLKTTSTGINTTDYITTSGEIKNTANYSCAEYNINTCINNGIPLTMKGQFYSKLTTKSFNSNFSYTAQCYRPFIATEQDLSDYNILPTLFTVDTTYYTFGFNKSRYMATKDKNAHLSEGYETLLSDGTKTLLQKEEGNAISFKGTTVNISEYLTLNKVDIGRFSQIDSGSFADNNGSGRKGETYIKKMPTTDGKQGLTFSTTGNQKTWVNLFGKASDNDENKIKNGYVWGDNYTGADGVLYQLVAQTKNGNYECFNAFARGFGNNGSRTQVFAKQNNQATFINVGGMYTFAQYVASCLARIYYRDASGTTQKSTVLEDIITCTPYTETWRKDFVINFHFDNLEKVILIQKISYSDYMKSLKEVMGELPTELTLVDNVDQQIINIQFEHTIDYDVTKLVDLYDYFNSNNIFIMPDITGEVSGQLSVEDSADIMYLDIKNATLVSSPDNLPIVPLTHNGNSVFSWNSQIGNSLGNLNNFTKYLNITLDGIWAAQKSNQSSLYIHQPSSDDFNENNYFGFNSNLSIIPFNLIR